MPQQVLDSGKIDSSIQKVASKGPSEIPALVEEYANIDAVRLAN